MIRRPEEVLCCSFCGKSQNEVKKLIAGPSVYICNECIDICNEIINDDERTEAVTERAPLLVPPNTRSLPPPGSPAVTRADWPADTDKERRRLAALRKAEEEKKEAAAEPNTPYAGKPKLLDKMLGKSKTSVEDGEVVDVPDPDPGDKTVEDKARERATTTTTATNKPVDQSLNAPTPPADPFPAARK